MANVLSVVYAVIGIVLMHGALLVWTALMLPGPVERARRRLAAQPVASFFWGILFCVLTVVVIAAFLPLRARGGRILDGTLEQLATRLEATRAYNDTWILINLPTWLIAAPVLAGVIVGGASYCQLFAARARPMLRHDSPLGALMLGAICLSLGYFFPLVGWFIFLPLVGFSSVGAGVWGIFSRRQFEPPARSSRPRQPS